MPTFIIQDHLQLRRGDPFCYYDKPGMGANREQLSARACGFGLSGIFYHGMRGHLRRAGEQLYRNDRYSRNHIQYRGVYRCTVLYLV